ncbi:MAG: hypothetical protein IT186_19125 [Acidobacteria bacterium]|nr:hypothetical protein [Acidobacteriota bacterium]MCG3194822.1 hypothetical protein [Thermoanaerobaculia bacterium]MCK6685749.1 hypothetical protein [Thermoanaerobaculia bacterium]
MERRTLLLGTLALAALEAAGAARNAGTELYGRPLRGLTPVTVPELLKEPAKYSGRAIAVRGTARSIGPRGLTLEEGGASLTVVPDGTYSFPEGPAGAAVRAEGKLAEGQGAGGPEFIASGVELSL